MDRKILQIILGILVTATLVLGTLVGGVIYITKFRDEGREEVAVSEQEENDVLISQTGSNTVIEDTHTTAELVPEETTTEPDTSIQVQGNGTGDTYTATTEEEIAYMKYVDSRILDSTAERSTAPMYVIADTDVYSEMSLESEILGQVTFNQELAVYGNVDGWFVIQYGDRDGFVPEEYIDSVKQQIVAESTEKPEVVESSSAVPEVPAATQTTPTETVTQQPVEPTPEVSTEIVDSDTNAGVPIEDSNDGYISDAEMESVLNQLEELGIISKGTGATGNGTVINPNSKPASDGVVSEETKELTKDWIVH